MQHDRDMASAILADIGGAQALGHVEIELQRAALPIAPKGIAQVELELRSIKGTLARRHCEIEPRCLHRVAEASLGMLPDRIAADALLGSGRKFDHDILEA